MRILRELMSKVLLKMRVKELRALYVHYSCEIDEHVFHSNSFFIKKSFSTEVFLIL